MLMRRFELFLPQKHKTGNPDGRYVNSLHTNKLFTVYVYPVTSCVSHIYAIKFIKKKKVVKLGNSTVIEVMWDRQPRAKNILVFLVACLQKAYSIFNA